MINFIKDAVTAVSGIKSFLFNTDYRNNFDLQHIEYPCCVLTPIMRTNYDLKNIIRESAELQLSVVETAPYDYSGDDLYAINKRCSDLALQVIANLQVKSKLDKELTFEFILPSGDELISGVMCNLQCTMKQGSCIGAPSYVEIVVQPIKRESITSNGKHVISADSGFTAMREVEVDVNVDLKASLQDKQVTITENGTTTIVANEGFEGLNSVEVVSDVWEGFSDDDAILNAQIQRFNELVKTMITNAKNGVYSGMSNIDGYKRIPPFFYKKRTHTILYNNVYNSPFFCSYILDIYLDDCLFPYKFTTCFGMFNNLRVPLPRTIDMGITHDYTDVTSVNSMFKNSFIKEIIWGNLVEAKNITNFNQMFFGIIFINEIDMSPIHTRSGTSFDMFVGTSGGYITSPNGWMKIIGIDWYNATSLNQPAYNKNCDIYADNWRLCNLNLSNTTMHGDAVAYIIEHACGEDDGAIQRTMSLNATTKNNFKALENYEELLALASEKLITISI